MTEEDFLAWREHPVSQWFFRAHEVSAALCERAWKEASWDSGVADQAALSVLKAKYEVFRGVVDADFSDIEARQDEHERD